MKSQSKKVTVEITPNNYSIIVSINGTEYRQKHVKNSTGSRQISGENFEDIPEISDELCDALCSFFPFDVMYALRKG